MNVWDHNREHVRGVLQKAASGAVKYIYCPYGLPRANGPEKKF